MSRRLDMWLVAGAGDVALGIVGDHPKGRAAEVLKDPPMTSPGRFPHAGWLRVRRTCACCTSGS